MKLRSSRVLKRGKPKIRKGDNCDENVEMCVKEGVNMDDKGLFLGSEVLDPIKDCVVSCTKIEVEEGNESVSSETGRGLKEEVKSLIVFGGDNDDDKETLLDELENARVLSKRKRKHVEGECNGDVRAKKEKVEKGEVHVSGRVLRSRGLTGVSGGVVAVDGGLSEENVEKRGKKKKLERRGRPRKVQNETKDGNPRPKKKLKRGRGRPRKVQKDGILIEKPRIKVERRGRPRKVQGEITISPLVKKDGILIEKPRKKVERRGRPRKVQGEITISPLVKKDGKPRKKVERRGRPRKMVSHEISSRPTSSRGRPLKVQTSHVVIQKRRLKDRIFKKRKRCGKTPKMEARTLATHVMKMRSVKLKAVKTRPTFQKIQKTQKDEKSSELAVDEGVIGERLERGKMKQLIRDKISDMLLKSGWTIDLRQRQNRNYKDSVYIEPNGARSHWSITGAYAMLKKKIEDGRADDNEIAAYSPISEEEISMLFRHVDKELGYKKKRKRKVKKGKIVTDKKKNKNGSKKVTDSRKTRLLARASETGSKQDDNGVFVIKKRNLLSWMTDSGVIGVGSKVTYGTTRRRKSRFAGTVTDDGITCGCCNAIMGVSEFVSHCGGTISTAFDDLYLESGTSFRRCLMDSWKKEEEELNIVTFKVVDVEGDDPNDDTCNVCGDGGNLICCDGCPSTFHQSCLDIQNFPSGDWNCIYCSCKFCGVVSVTTPQVEDSHDEITSEMLSCRLCEEKFHRSCLQGVEDVNTDSERLPFCGRKCQEIFERLQTYLGVKHELEDGFSWTLLRRCDVGEDLTVHETQAKVECNSKLAVAFSVMDECFVPIVDERSGTNIIHNVVYNCGSNFKRLNYAGFLTAVLEKGDELITTASIRIHGYRLAEMPFIGTRHMHRRQGMCRRLLDAIESALYSIGVEELIIPAIPQLLQTWTKVFGFMSLEESEKQAMKSMSMIVFPGIDMLKKPLVQNRNPSEVSDDKTAETVSSNVTDYKETPLDTPDGVGKDIINHKQTEETTDAISVGKDAFDDEPTQEPTVEKDLENDTKIIPHDDISVCDLNLPCDTNGQTSVDSECFQDYTTNSENHRLPESTELKLHVENDDGIPEVKVEVEQSPLTSELVLKNKFDLNLDPSVVEADMHVICDDSKMSVKSVELSDLRSLVDPSVVGQPDCKPCESQPLVLL